VQLIGLQKEFDFYASYRDLHSAKWMDFKVTLWTVEEVDLAEAVQVDE
jgi:hypothetical protein